MKTSSELFKEGYNCSQAIFSSNINKFSNIDFETSLKLSSAFGGGIGRMRNICGAIIGVYMLLGLKYNIDTLNDSEKEFLYKKVQEVTEKFKNEFGSIYCKDLLKTDDTDPKPTTRNDEFYQSRPCLKIIEFAQKIIDEEKNPSV